MLSFEYTIELNEKGRPFIKPKDEEEVKLYKDEHAFMGIEIVRAILTNLIVPAKDDKSISDERYKIMVHALIEINNLAEFHGDIVKAQMELLGSANKSVTTLPYDFHVQNRKELDGLNYNGIIYGDQLFKREIGLKVFVEDDNKIYELIDGIDNSNWIDVTDKA